MPDSENDNEGVGYQTNEMFAFPDIIHKMLERVFILFHVKVAYRALNPAAKGALPRRSNAFCLSSQRKPYEKQKNRVTISALAGKRNWFSITS